MQNNENVRCERTVSIWERWESLHRPRIVHALAGRGVDWHDAEDVAQDVSIKAVSALAEGRGPGFDDDEEGRWFWRIACNAAIDLYRRSRARARHSVQLAEAGERRLPSADPVAELERSETVEVVRAAIRRLDPRLRLVVRLRLEGRTYGEIAEAANLSVDGVKARWTRGRIALERILGDFLP